MTALGRVTQKKFGSSAATNEAAIFGSLAAGTPTYVNTPFDAAAMVSIQSNANFLAGWYSAILGNNSPTIQDMNALFILAFYQLSYLLEAGVPEWIATTTYYTYSIVRGGSSTNGGLYQSITDSNLNNAVTDTTYWKRIDNTGITTKAVANVVTVLTAADSDITFDVTTTAGVASFTLPATIPAGFTFTVKDVTGNFATNPVTITRSGSETIEGYAGNFLCEAAYGTWEFYFDGTNIWLR